MLDEYLKKTEPEYYPPVENLLDLIYEHYTENNPVEKNTVAGKTAKAKEKELEGMDRLVDDYDTHWGTIPVRNVNVQIMRLLNTGERFPDRSWTG